MNDFDTQLRARLERLEASVPAPAAPSTTSRRARGLNRRRQVIVLLAATLSLLGGTAFATIANQPPPDPVVLARNEADETRLRDDLGAAFGGACLDRGEAMALIRERLEVLGLSNWTIRSDDRIREARCVGAAPIGDNHEVLLLPSMGGNVATALDALRDELMRRCATRDEAVGHLRALLVDGGVTEPKVGVRSELRVVPIDSADAYIKHFQDGCALYSDAQFDDVGRYTWFIAAR